jgi:hypothetical protein
MNKKVIILRGCSGAGKSTVAHLFGGKSVICTADDFFYDEKGIYNFDAFKLSDAHTACRLKFVTAIHDDSIETIIVANTNTQEKEFDFYLDYAKQHDIMYFSLVIENRHGNENVHSVPNYVLERQRDNIIQNLRLI